MRLPSTSTGLLVVCSRCMPRQSEEHWAVGTVVVSRITSVVQNLGDLIVDLHEVYISAVRAHGRRKVKTNLLILFLGGDEVGSNFGRLDTRFQGCLGTLDSIARAVDVPGDATSSGSTETCPKKGVGRTLWRFSGVFSETGTPEGRCPVGKG